MGCASIKQQKLYMAQQNKDMEIEMKVLHCPSSGHQNMYLQSNHAHANIFTCAGDGEPSSQAAKCPSGTVPRLSGQGQELLRAHGLVSEVHEMVIPEVLPWEGAWGQGS